MSQHEDYTSPPGFRVSGGNGTKLAPVLIDPTTPLTVGDTVVWNGTTWVPTVSGGPAWLMSGEGTPVGTVTPVQQGAVYQDLINGTLYLALGATDADWVGLGAPGANGIGENPGLLWNSSRDGYLLVGRPDVPTSNLYMSSAWQQWNGPSNGLVFSFAVDGGLSVGIRTGSTGDLTGTLQDNFGNMIVPGTITAKRRVLYADDHGALDIVDGIVTIRRSGAANLTLADPAAGDEGISLTITAQTAHAHTVSNAAGSGFNGAGAGADVATFGGAVGDTMVVVAINQKWHVVSLRGVTLG
jgi:hypothetical protein